MTASRGVVIHRNVAIMRVSAPAVLAEIRAVVPLDDFVLATVGDTELVIDPARVGELAAQLEARGMPALVKRARGARLPPSSPAASTPDEEPITQPWPPRRAPARKR